MRPRYYLSALVAVAVGLVTATVAHAVPAPTPVVTKRGWQYLPAATPNGAYVAYTESHFFRRRTVDTVFVKPAGAPRVQVTRRRHGFAGGFDGTTLIYQVANFRRGQSDIHLYDAATKVKSTPPGVNTRAWEYEPTMSGNVILFGRSTRRRWRILLRDENTSTTTVLLNAPRRPQTLVDPGQIDGNWATWSRFSFRSNLGNVWRYDISGHHAELIPRPSRRAQYAPSIAPSGAMFYIRAKTGCGHHVVLRENVPGEADMPLYQFPAGYDVFKTYVVDEGGGVSSVYFDRVKCGTNRADIYKLTVS
jgi:hypothetical protein